jgi:hypothetical protein
MNTDNQLTWNGIKDVMRWIAIIPCAGAVSYLIKYPVQSSPMLIQFPVSLLAFGVYIWIAALLAPAHKYKAALYLTFIAGGISFLIAYGRMRGANIHPTALEWFVFLLSVVLNLAVGVLVSFTFRPSRTTK